MEHNRCLHGWFWICTGMNHNHLLYLEYYKMVGQLRIHDSNNNMISIYVFTFIVYSIRSFRCYVVRWIV